MRIVITKEEVRFPRKYESNRYAVTIEKIIDEELDLSSKIQEFFEIIRKEIERQKKLDGIVEITEEVKEEVKKKVDEELNKEVDLGGESLIDKALKEDKNP